MDWTVDQARSKHSVISGFHSPLERSVLEVLLTAHGRAVIGLARDVREAKLPSAWREAASKDEIAIVSVNEGAQRLTQDLARLRNDWVAKLSGTIMIAHAQSGGQLELDATRWRSEGHNVQMLPQ
jgi:hypothetical protein